MISTHILDTSWGNAAANVSVRLELKEGQGWKLISNEKTNADGRAVFSVAAQVGVYRLSFDIETYYSQLGQASFFHEPQIAFSIKDCNRKYHVPLLLNPFGYTTYRGT